MTWPPGFLLSDETMSPPRKVGIHPMVKVRVPRDHRRLMKQNTPSTSSKSASKVSNGHSAHPSPSAYAFTPSAEAVAVRAYLNYQNHGAADVHDVEDWLAAEAALCAEQGLAHT